MILVLLLSLHSSFAIDKKIIALEQPETISIDLPDNQKKDFGYDYYLRLVSHLLKTDRYVVLDQMTESLSAESDEYFWRGKVLPSAKLSLSLDAMSFTTGSRGGRMFYGFDEKNPYVDVENEFPVSKKNPASQYFSPAFDPKGNPESGSLAGLDLGDGFELNVIFAFLKVNYAAYRARMKLLLKFEIPFTKQIFEKTLDVKAKGYFYDVSGGFSHYSGALALARKDAWLKTFDRLIDGTQSEITKVLEQTPFTGVVNEIVSSGDGKRYLVGTGRSSQIHAGMKYVDESGSLIFEVIKSVTSGSVCKLIQGNENQVQRGLILRDWNEISGHQEFLSSHSAEAELPDQNLEKIKFGKIDLDINVTPLLQRLRRMVFLPFRIWKYFQYDQKIKTRQQKYNGEPLVAILDSGVDYNSREFRNRLWIDPEGGHAFYGWDFISGDQRPFSDHAHGTYSAERVVDHMRDGKLMVLKTHNPWGVTRSDILVRAMRFAADKGARVVLTDWATYVDARAFRMMAEIAEQNDMLWVTMRGDGKSYPAKLSLTHKNILSIGNAAAIAGKAAQIRAEHPTWSSERVIQHLL